MIRRATRRLAADARGATIVEFAIVAPVMILVILGLGDLSYQAYAAAILTGAVQKAGRDAAIQGGADQLATLDGKVIAMVGTVVRNPTNACPTGGSAATWCSTRASFSTFQLIKPEDFVDRNGNGVCDNGESFTDINGNGSWDTDPGISGQGGAEDVTRYTMTLTYPRIFPMAKLLGWSATNTISATTYLKNQPYDTQFVPATATGICK